MKIQSILISGFLLLNGLVVHANDATMRMKQDKDAAINQEHVAKITPEFLYSYIDFDFDSTQSLSFNRFQGHSNLYAVGGDNVRFYNDSMIAGLYYFHINTNVNSQFLVNDTPQINSYQSIDNNTLFGHIRKAIDKQFAIDLSSGYGQNDINSQSYAQQNTPQQFGAFSHYYGYNWFAAINGLYNTSWDKILLNASMGILYTQIDNDVYPVAFDSGLPPALRDSVNNHVIYLMENVELGYKLNSAWTPFINGGLLQVGNFGGTPTGVVPQINGSLPQLSLDRSAYRVGGGLMYVRNQFTLRVEQKYYNSHDTFTSNQTIVGLEYRFN